MQNFGVMTLVAGTPVVRSVRLFSCLPSTTRRRFFFIPIILWISGVIVMSPYVVAPSYPAETINTTCLPQRRFRTAEPR